MPKNNLSLRYNRFITERNDVWDKIFSNLFWPPYETMPSYHRRIGSNYTENSTAESEDEDDLSIEPNPELSSSDTSVTTSEIPSSPSDQGPSSLQFPSTSNLPSQHRCPSCPRSFRFLCQLRNHEATHTAQRPWSCNCGKCFKSALALHLHRKRSGHHNWTVQCDRCGQTFAKAWHMKRHSGAACEASSKFCPALVLRKSAIGFFKKQETFLNYKLKRLEI